MCDGIGNARCIVGLTILYQGLSIYVGGGRNGEVILDGSTLTLPFSNENIYVKQVTSLFKLIRGFGFHILFDSAQRVYVNLGSHYLDKVMTFCIVFRIKCDCLAYVLKTRACSLVLRFV